MSSDHWICSHCCLEIMNACKIIATNGLSRKHLVKFQVQRLKKEKVTPFLHGTFLLSRQEPQNSTNVESQENYKIWFGQSVQGCTQTTTLVLFYMHLHHRLVHKNSYRYKIWPNRRRNGLECRLFTNDHNVYNVDNIWYRFLYQKRLHSIMWMMFLNLKWWILPLFSFWRQIYCRLLLYSYKWMLLNRWKQITIYWCVQ